MLLQSVRFRFFSLKKIKKIEIKIQLKFYNDNKTFFFCIKFKKSSIKNKAIINLFCVC